MGYVPAVEKVIELASTADKKVETLYIELQSIAETGDDSAIIAMNKLEKKFNSLVIKQPTDAQKIIENAKKDMEDDED